MTTDTRPSRRPGLRRPSLAAIASTALLAGLSPLLAGDGDLDPSWGGDGISNGFANSLPRSAAVAPDGQVYFTGSTTLPDDSEFEWWRSNNEGNGQWFGCTQGLALLGDFVIHDTAFDGSGRLLYAGSTTVFGSETVERAFVARFESFAEGESCALDSTFSGAGWEYFDDAPYCDTEDCRLIGIEVTADTTTRYIALLESVQNALISKYYLLGLTAAGALDPNFNGGDFLLVTATDGALLGGGAAKLAVDRGNRALVLYSFYDPEGNFDLDVALNRYQQPGVLDGTFATNGRMLIDAADAEDTSARALAIGSDGRLGYAVRSHTNFSKIRVFDRGLSSSVGAFLDLRDVRAIAFDGLGRVLAASDLSTGDGLEIGRWTPIFGGGGGLEPDAGFGVGGVRSVDIDGGGGNTETPVDLELSGGRPMLLAEADQTAGGKQAFLVRLQNDLIFADGFEWGSTKFW